MIRIASRIPHQLFAFMLPDGLLGIQWAGALNVSPAVSSIARIRSHLQCQEARSRHRILDRQNLMNSGVSNWTLTIRSNSSRNCLASDTSILHSPFSNYFTELYKKLPPKLRTSVISIRLFRMAGI